MSYLPWSYEMPVLSKLRIMLSLLLVLTPLIIPTGERTWPAGTGCAPAAESQSSDSTAWPGWATGSSGYLSKPQEWNAASTAEPAGRGAADAAEQRPGNHQAAANGAQEDSSERGALGWWAGRPACFLTWALKTFLPSSLGSPKNIGGEKPRAPDTAQWNE